MTAHYRIQVDHAACQGSGLCTGMASQFFELNGDGLSRPRRELVEADADGVQDLLDAAECCPLEAIAVTDADTGKSVI